MSNGYMVALSVAAQATLAVISGQALAGGPVSNDSDILGIKLTMSREQVKKTITDSFPNASIVELPVQMGTPEFSKATVAGFVADITAKDDQANNDRKTQQAAKEFEAKKAAGFGDTPLNRTVSSPGDYGRDRLVVVYDPNAGSSGIFSISRRKEFAKSNFPVTKVLLDSFAEKFGQPSRSEGSSFTWTAPGVLQRTQNSRAKCYGGSFGYFYEGSLFDGADQNYQSFIGRQFVGMINLISSREPARDYSMCGTVLQANFNLSNDRLYVVRMEETLIDLTQGYSTLKAFADDFWLRANAAKQDKVTQDSKNKPKL